MIDLSADYPDDDKGKVLGKAKLLFSADRLSEAAALMTEAGFSHTEIEHYFIKWYNVKRTKWYKVRRTGPEQMAGYSAGPIVRESKKKEGKPGKTMGDLAAEVLLSANKELKKEEKLEREGKPGKPRKGKFWKNMRVVFGHSRVEEVVGSLALIIAGMTGAAILGSMWIFFAFLSLGIYVILPDTDEVVGRQLRKLENKLEDYIARAESEEDLKKRKAIAETKTKIEMKIQTLKSGQGIGRTYASLGFKYLLKALFFVFFSLGFITSALPLFKPIGILIAFIGYFVEG